jgi:hypothetical protein
LIAKLGPDHHGFGLFRHNPDKRQDGDACVTTTSVPGPRHASTICFSTT